MEHQETPTQDASSKEWPKVRQAPAACFAEPSDDGGDCVTTTKTVSYATFALANAQDLAKLETAASILMVLSLYLMLVFVFELEYFLPYDGGFAIVILWSCSIVCGRLMEIVGMPPLLGMLCAGIALKNIGDPVRGLPDAWAAGIRAFGLMNILMRGGLEMDVGAVKRVGFAVVRLTVMPGVSEAFFAAFLATYIFEMPFFLAIALGFILAAVSPAVVVGGMFNLQSRGYGVAQGIPSLVVAAASFDDVVAISGFSMFIGLASGHGNIMVEALHGPINIVGGGLFGVLGACVLSVTRLWNTREKRSFMMLTIGTIYTFAAKKAHFAGAGALACLVMAAVAAQLWARGAGGASLSLGPDPHAAHLVENDLCKVWKYAAEPLLFSVIGAALDFKQIEPGTIPKAILLVIGAVVIRCIVAYFATCATDLKTKERIFIALAWMPKATVQAALGPVPLDMMRRSTDRSQDPEQYAKNERLGVDILTTAVFAILLTAPVGLIVIQYLGPLWLEKGHPATPGGTVQTPPTIDRVEDIGPEDLSSDFSEILPKPPSAKLIKDPTETACPDSANLIVVPGSTVVVSGSQRLGQTLY